MRRLAAFAALFLIVFGVCAPAAMAQGVLTRAGPYIGAKHIIITKSLEYDMKRAGIPDRCRMEAHQVLGQLLAYGYNDAPDKHPTLDILCDFKATSGGATGMMGKTIGTRGSVGGVRYVHFVSDDTNVERFILPGAFVYPSEEPERTSFLNHFLTLVVAGNKALLPGMRTELICSRTGTCGAPAVLRMPVNAVTLGQVAGHRDSFITDSGHASTSEHAGADFPAACGTDIVMPCSGKVTFSGAAGGCGNMIKTQCDNGYTTKYCHTQAGSSAGVGSTVSQGTAIARVGTTGNSTGCHLHYEVRNASGQLVDATTMSTVSGAPTGVAASSLLGGQVASVDNALNKIPNFDEEGGGPGGTLQNGCSSGASRPCGDGSV